MNKRVITWAFVFIFIFLFFILEINFNLLDSDSGREIQRATLFNNNGLFDGGPLISQIVYSSLSFLYPENLLLILKFLNIIIFVLLLIFSLKIIDLWTNTESKKIIFIILLFSVHSIFFLIFYYKPYLLLSLFVTLSIFYYFRYMKLKDYTSIFLAGVFISFSVLIKNHAYPFIIFPFIMLILEFIRAKKINFKAVIYLILPFLVIFFPYFLVSLQYMGTHFWHFPNTWFFKEGLSSYISTNFWKYPVPSTLNYFIGQKNFLIESIPLMGLFILLILFSGKYNKFIIELFGLLILLSFLPFLLGVMPFYQQYNYLVSILIIFFISLTWDKILRDKNFRIITLFFILTISFVMIAYNLSILEHINNNSSPTIREFTQSKIGQKGGGILLARDFKLQPYSPDNILFVDVASLEERDIINIFSVNASEKEFKNSLDKNNIRFLLFYKNKKYNEEYYSVLMSFFNMSFSMDKFENSPLLTKLDDSENIVVFECPSCVNQQIS